MSTTHEVHAITRQVGSLRRLFPYVTSADVRLAERPLPAGAEGWFAIPRWQRMAPTYTEAVEMVLTRIGQTRRFKNWHDGRLGPRYLRQLLKTADAFEQLGAEQRGCDILIVAAQFGHRHRRRSVRQTREFMDVSEFGLGVFAVGIMLLTHPERLMKTCDLYIDCVGDEYTAEVVGDLFSAPFFRFDGVRMELYDYGSGIFDFCGSASGFLPQR